MAYAAIVVGMILAATAFALAVMFFKRVDKFIRLIAEINKIPSEDAGSEAPSDEEFKKQARDFAGEKPADPDEIVIEKADEGHRVKIEKKEEVKEL